MKRIVSYVALVALVALGLGCNKQVIPPQVPWVPVALSPASGAVNQPTTVTFTWESCVCAKSYTVQVALDSSFSVPIFNQPDLTGSTATISGLAPGKTYYWHVSSTNNAGASLWSPFWSFTTASSSASTVPVLNTPTNGSTGLPTSVAFTWGSVSGAQSYDIEISTDPSFAVTIADVPGVTDTTAPVGGLTDGTTYYWRVNATLAGPTTGSWSGAWSFTVGSSSTVSAPALGSPSNGSTLQQTSVSLSWGSVGGAVSYNVLVSTDPSFATTVTGQFGVTALTAPVSGLVNGTTYYWKVNASNGTTSGPWSNAWSFIINLNQTTVPTAPTNGSPADGATNQPTSIILNWSVVSNATSYSVRVSTDAGFATTILYQQGLNLPTIIINGLDTGKTYYWQVTASNAAGTSSWSGVWRFTTTVIPLPSMVVIIGATFRMGSDDALDYRAQPAHDVTLTSSYYMDKTPVTQASFEQIMGWNPSGFGPAPNLPVEQVSWFDAALYCNARSKLSGLDTVYSYTSKTTSGHSCTDLPGLHVDFTKHGFRLPTEAEWEFACRGGTTTPYYWGSDSSIATFGRYAWDTANASGTTQEVGKKLPNAFGLYDMSGNVWEWCNDWFSNYGPAQQINPTGPAVGSWRVLRGGSWWDNAIYERSAYRFADTPDLLFSNYGFRCVLR